MTNNIAGNAGGGLYAQKGFSGTYRVEIVRN